MGPPVPSLLPHTMVHQKKDRSSPASIETTVNLHKRLHGITFKRRAPRAVRELKKFAVKTMGTNDVRVTNELNQYLWSRGVRNVPYRVRIRLDRKRDLDSEDGSAYTIIDHVPVESFKGLTTKSVEVEE